MKRIFTLLGILLVMALVMAGCGTNDKANSTGEQPAKQPDNQEAKQEVITLKLADSVPITHVNSKVVAKYFIERVDELTNGRVKIEYFGAEQLGKQKDLLNLNSQGIADIALLAPSYLSGQLPLNSVMILPFYSSAVEGTEVYKRLKATGLLDEEFKKYGLMPLFVHTTPPYDVVTTKKPIKSPNDLKGMKLHASGGIYNEIATKYGVTPVSVASPEMYEATQRGVVEGAFLSYPAVKSYKLNELVKYLTYGASFGGYPVVYTVNEQKWQSLPEDIQKALTQAGEDTAKVAGEAWDQKETEVLKEFEQQGLEIYKLSSEEKEKWKEPMKTVGQEWTDDMEKKGLPGKKVFEEFVKAVNEVQKK